MNSHEIKLTPEIVIRAYCQGIFPMGDQNEEIHFYSPDPRCIIDLNEFHASERLIRTYKQHLFDIRINTVWDEVIQQCTRLEEPQKIWITDQIIEVYTQLHKLGFAHSVEAYKDNILVGGLYGVSLGGAFMGESMFHNETDASKVCLVYLVERLKQKGYQFIDCQYMTEHLAKFGAKLISRDQYLLKLESALKLNCQFS